MCDSCRVIAMPVRRAGLKPPARAWVASLSPISWQSLSVVVLTPARVGIVVQVAIRERRGDLGERSRSSTDVDHDAVVVETDSRERRIDDEGRTVQLLRRTEDLAGEAVGDHDVVTHCHREAHGVVQSIVWQRPGAVPSARDAMTVGSSVQGDVPPSSAS